MAQAIVESLDMETFGSLKKYTSRAKSPQWLAIQAMQPGQALLLSHEGFSHCISSKCSMRGTLWVKARNQLPHTFSWKHLPDGRLGVACFAKED